MKEDLSTLTVLILSKCYVLLLCDFDKPGQSLENWIVYEKKRIWTWKKPPPPFFFASRKAEGGEESHKILTNSAFNADTIAPAQLCTLHVESIVVHWELPCALWEGKPNGPAFPLDIANDLQKWMP